MPLIAGVHNVTATPFLPDESLDEASLGSLVRYCVETGCDGMLILGVLGEADRLSDVERDRVIAKVVEENAGRLEITVGITHGSSVVTAERARRAVELGAHAVMVSPPPGSTANPALRDHYARAAAATDAIFVVQDHPTSSGVKMPTDFLLSLIDVLPKGSVLKLEDPPTAPKTAAITAQTDAYQILGGLGGVSLLAELDAGSHGTMTGFAIPEVLVAIVAAHQAGNRDEARRVFTAALPLMVFEAQPGAGVALRKEILKRRGALAHATVRQPAPKPDAFSIAAMERLLNEFAAVS